MKNIDVLYDLCETISDEIEESNEKIRMAGGKLTAGDVDYIDKLTHTLKSLKTTIAMEEAGDEYSYDDGGSYARGNSRVRARRDSRGRYSRERGYSRADGIKEMLKEAMNEAESEREREAIRKAIKELDR